MKLVSYFLYSLIAGSITQSPQYTNNENITDTIWGHQVQDPYQWLENLNSSRTISWIEKQNDYSNSHQVNTTKIL